MRLRAGSNGYPLGLGLPQGQSTFGQPAQASAFILRRFAGSDGAQPGDEFVAADDKVFSEFRCAELHEDPQSLPGADLEHALDDAPNRIFEFANISRPVISLQQQRSASSGMPWTRRWQRTDDRFTKYFARSGNLPSAPVMEGSLEPLFSR